MFEELKNIWLNERNNNTVSDEELFSFEDSNKVKLPEDVVSYFKTFNGTKDMYDDNFFKFYSLDEFKKIQDAYDDWEGIPNYKNIVNTLLNYEYYYVFADYNFSFSCYAIRLYEKKTEHNQILVICGDEFKEIANSFSEFLELYVNKSDKLYI